MGRFPMPIICAALLVCTASGCGTLLDRGIGPCPKSQPARIYGGVRHDVAFLEAGYFGPIDSVAQRVLYIAGTTAFAAVDLPLSAVADTILLPVMVAGVFQQKRRQIEASENAIEHDVPSILHENLPRANEITKTPPSIRGLSQSGAGFGK